MPELRVYLHGGTARVPPMHPSKPPVGIRGESRGWTATSARSNRQFLWSIDYDGLTGNGFSVTLTVRETPPSYEDWRKLLQNLFKRLRRMDLIRGHWVVEWQARGAPHLHLSLFFPPPTGTDWADTLRAGERPRYATIEGHRVLVGGHPYSDGTIMGGDLLIEDGDVWRTEPMNPAHRVRWRDSHLRLIDKQALRVVDAWVAVCGTEPNPARPGETRNRAEPWSQEAVPIFDEGGWFHYVAKHAARGTGNYQRARTAAPPDDDVLPEDYPRTRSGGKPSDVDPLPKGWTKTGRMWGHLGEWPCRDDERVIVDDSTFFAYRRVVRAHRKSMARRTGNGRTIRAARTLLKWPKPAGKRRTVHRQSPEEAARTSAVMPTSVDLEKADQLRAANGLRDLQPTGVPGEFVDTGTGEIVTP